MEEEQARLASGRLPERRRYRLFAGYLHGSLCDSCGCPIRTMDVLYEIVFEDTPQVIVSLHRECLPVWRGKLIDHCAYSGAPLAG